MEHKKEFAENEALSISQLLMELRPHFGQEDVINEDTVANKVEELLPHLSIADQARLTESFLASEQAADKSSDTTQ